MINSYGFPSCCSAKVLTGFGRNSASLSGDEATLTKKEIIEKVWEAKITSNGVVTIITNSKQKKANKFLLELGFKHSKWMSKQKHPETKIRLWWMPLEDFEP